MKKIMLLLVLGQLNLFPAEIDLKVSSSQDVILPGMAVFIDIEVSNSTSRSIEIPKVRDVSFGGSGNQLCQNVLTTEQNETVSKDQFRLDLYSSKHGISPLPTELINPSETKYHTFFLGHARKAGIYKLHIACDYFEDPEKYEKYHYSLNKKIHTEAFTSNTIILEVMNPSGIEKTVYDKYISQGNHDSRQKTVEMSLQYPESHYSLYFMVREFISCAFKNDCNLASTDQVESTCKNAKTFCVYQPIDDDTPDHVRKVKQKRMDEINALSKLLEHHEASTYFFALKYKLGWILLQQGLYTESREHFEQTSRMKPKKEQDSEFIRVANDYLKFMKKYDLD